MKTFIVEITILLLTILFSIGLYHISIGIDLRYDTYLDMLTFELRRTFLVFDLTTRFILPIYFVVTIIRLIYFRFKRVYIAVIFVISALTLLAGCAFNLAVLYSDAMVPAEEGWTIYPPLVGRPDVNAEDVMQLSHEKTVQWFVFSLLVLSIVTTILLTRKQLKNKT